jgi:dienelactone hydrolase
MRTSTGMAIQKRDLEYRHGDTLCRGELAWDDQRAGRRPGVFVVHEGGGLNDHPKRRAALLAELGYVALAGDMYGGGEFVSDPQRRGELMGGLRNDPAKLRGRAQAGLDALAAQPLVDSAHLAAIGFCFGGMTVLELARSGAAIDGVVSFHGILDTLRPAEPGAIKAKILVLHGADDPFAPPPKVNAFIEEMRHAQADWQLHAYGGAQHGFTRPDASQLGIPGVAYHAETDRRAWKAMQVFFAELFGAGAPPAPPAPGIRA